MAATAGAVAATAAGVATAAEAAVAEAAAADDRAEGRVVMPSSPRLVGCTRGPEDASRVSRRQLVANRAVAGGLASHRRPQVRQVVVFSVGPVRSLSRSIWCPRRGTTMAPSWRSIILQLTNQQGAFDICQIAVLVVAWARSSVAPRCMRRRIGAG